MVSIEMMLMVTAVSADDDDYGWVDNGKANYDAGENDVDGGDRNDDSDKNDDGAIFDD